MDTEFLSKIEKLVDGKESCITDTSKISMLEERYAEDIYLLILQYFVKNSNEKSLEKIKNIEEFPYGGKIATKEGKGLNYKLANLPEPLQKIIVRYLITITQ